MITFDLISNYILGALVTSGVITLWFFSNLPVHLFKSLRLIKSEDEVFTWEDWQLWICSKSDYFGELLSCPLCLGFWLSLTTSGSLVLLNGLTPWFILASVLSWPVFLYYFYNNFSNGNG